MEALEPKILTRLRIGLAALMLGLIFDAVDLQLNDIDVLHDIAAAVLLGIAGWGIGQAAATAGVAPMALFLVPALALGGGLIIDAIDPGWSANRFFQMGRFALYVGGLVAIAFSMAKVSSEVGLSSSVKWRRAGLQLLLLILVPGLVISVFMLPPSPSLPFRHHVGKIDGSTVKTIVGYLAMAAALLATFDTVMASFATWRSAGRRVGDD